MTASDASKSTPRTESGDDTPPWAGRNPDPLGAMLKNHLRLNPITFGLFVLVADLVVDAFLGWRYEVFTTSGDKPGLLQDWTALAADFGAIPIIAGLYLWTIDAHLGLFVALDRSGVFKSAGVVERTYQRSKRWLEVRLLFLLIVVVALAYTGLQVAAYNEWLPIRTVGGYLELDPKMSYFRAPFWFLNLYTILFAVYNVACAAIALLLLFRSQDVKIRPLHPDRSGGLSSISKYSIRVAYGLAAAGLVLSMAAAYEIQESTIRSALPLIAAIGAYVLLAPVFFFLPLATAHDAMQRAKNEELLAFANAIENQSERVKGIAMGGQGEIQTELQRLDLLNKLYETANAFPVWPFDFANLRRFFAVITAPLFPALISACIEVAKSELL